MKCPCQSHALDNYHRVHDWKGIPDLTSDHFAQWLKEKNFFESGLQLNDPFIEYDVARGKTFFGQQLASAFEVVEPASSPPATEPVAEVSRVKPRSPPVPEPSAEVLKEFYQGLPVYDFGYLAGIEWRPYRCPWPKCDSTNKKLTAIIEHANWHSDFLKRKGVLNYEHVECTLGTEGIQQALRCPKNMSDEEFEAKASKFLWRLLVTSGRDPTAKMVGRCYDS